MNIENEQKCERCGAKAALYHNLCHNCIKIERAQAISNVNAHWIEKGFLESEGNIEYKNLQNAMVTGIVDPGSILERFNADFSNYKKTSIRFMELKNSVDNFTMPPKPENRQDVAEATKIHTELKAKEKQVSDEKERFFRPVKDVQDVISETFGGLLKRVKSNRESLWRLIESATFEIEKRETLAAREKSEALRRAEEIDRNARRIALQIAEEQIRKKREELENTTIETGDDIYRIAEMQADVSALEREKEGMVAELLSNEPTVIPEVEVPMENKFKSQAGSVTTRVEFILDTESMSAEDFKRFYEFVMESKKFNLIQLNKKAIQERINKDNLDFNSITGSLPGIRIKKKLTPRTRI